MAESVTPATGTVVAGTLRWRAVIGTIVAAAMTVLDLSMTSTALGSIQSGVHSDLAKGALVLSAYATAELVTLALSAYLTRIFRPRPYLAMLVLCFVVGSLLSANAWNFESLLVARVVQGAASGAIMPFAYYAIVVLLPGPEHPKAIGRFSFVVTSSYVIAPILVITLAEWLSWRALYYVSAPVGLLALWLALPGLRDMPAMAASPFGRKVSVISILAAVVGLFFTQYTLDTGGGSGWLTSAAVVATAAIALGMLLVFVVNELRTRHPLIELRLLRQVPFMLSCAYNVIAGAAVYSSLFLIPYYLTTLDYSLGEIGVVSLYGAVAQLVVAMFLPFLLRNVDVYLVSVAGGVTFALGAFIPFLAGDSPGDAAIIGALSARAIGSGLLLASLGLMATRALRSADASSGSLLFNMARSLGGSMGAACCAAFVVAREASYAGTSGAELGSRSVRLPALHDVLALGSGLMVVLALVFLAGWGIRASRARRERPA